MYLCEDITGKTTKELQSQKKLSDLELVEFMQEHDCNSCDKCGKIYLTYDLVWITSEDFYPKVNENITENTYKKYDALCEDCYVKIATEKSNKEKNIILNFILWYTSNDFERQKMSESLDEYIREGYNLTD